MTTLEDLIKSLEKEINTCNVCGPNPSWKECGCEQEGYNAGINTAIKIIQAEIKKNS